MILKTLAFLLLLYLLVKFISGLFLPSSRRRNSTARIIFQTFKNIQQQQRKQQQSRDSRDRDKFFEEVEEAEYEDVTEEKPQSSEP